MPQMSEERFDRIDATLQQLVGRFDGVDKRLDGVDKRLDAVDKRLDAVEMGLTGLKVLHDETRDKISLVLEHVVATNERLECFKQDVDERFNKLEVDLRLVFDNHTRRIQALEQRS
jgi:archaellum component FlaC